MSAPNVRLVDPLKAEAASYARGLGVSLNALVAVALRDYLDLRKSSGSQPAVTTDATPGADGARPAPAAIPLPRPNVVQLSGKVGRNEPCPCGSSKKFKQCHGGAA